MPTESSSKIPKAIGPYRISVPSGNLLFLSGQIGLNPATGELAEGLENQTKQIMDNIKAILEEQGLGLSDIVKTTIILAQIEDFTAVNALYGQYFKENYPARSTFAVKALPKNALIEIEAIVQKRS